MPRTATTPTGLAFLTALDTALRENPPPFRDTPLLRRSAPIGVGPGLSPVRVGLTPAVLQALVASVDRTAPALPAISKQKLIQEALADRGWATVGNNIGDYGTDYLFRAQVAELGLGANTRQEAVYPTALTDTAGQPLDGANDYRLVFKPGQAPPNRAFWSLTLYNANGFLVANPAHRYAIGDTHLPLRREPTAASSS
jgi:hypothetical protein